MDEVYVSLLNIVSQEVVPHFYMFGSVVKHRGFGNTNGTRAIAHERYMGTLLTKVTKHACDCWRIKNVSLYDPQVYGPTPFSPRDSQGSCQSTEQGDYKRSIYLYTLATQTLAMIKLEND
jgi:hypothetical protein